jgi:hypothetical protein
MDKSGSKDQGPGGLLIRSMYAAGLPAQRQGLLDLAELYGLDGQTELREEDGRTLRLRLRADLRERLVPDFDTLHLCDRFDLHPQDSDSDLEKEILLAMLIAPVAFEYPDCDELAASIRIRRNIVRAARCTALSFDTEQAERPAGYWRYSEATGFIVQTGKPLIEALRLATQPAVSGQQYAFSCYRATEYVILLGIAEELAVTNPALLQRLQQQWETRAIMSGRYHDVFLREYGSMEEPLPPLYYVPGDRLWFRNPDERSSDVTGYEGSWVIYLGDGLFSNFWQCDRPYTLMQKCLEVYHWRDGVYQDDSGELRMDESIVEKHVRATLGNPAAAAQILEHMLRLRDPKGVYGEGGCIDASREYPRRVCPGSSDIMLPD